ncbi:MAG: hypothetical protein ACLQVD_04010 [Capsulimonadaceae bacterium]
MGNAFSRITGSLVVIAAFAAPLAAQADPVHPGVNARWRHQEQRIYQGARSGELTGGEYDRLQGRENRVRVDEAIDRSRHDGRLTGFERRRLERQENRDGRAIYRLKHNDRVQ